MLYENLLKEELQEFNETQEDFLYEIEKVEWDADDMSQSIIISEKWKDNKRIYRQYKFKNDVGIYSYDDQSDIDYLRFVPEKERDYRELEISLKLFELAIKCVNYYISE